VQKALEVDDPKKVQNQITDQTRNDPSSTGRTTDSKSKDTQNINKSEERKDFPEITPTVMSKFICKKCIR
jgi:hypothetical protein